MRQDMDRPTTPAPESTKLVVVSLHGKTMPLPRAREVLGGLPDRLIDDPSTPMAPDILEAAAICREEDPQAYERAYQVVRESATNLNEWNRLVRDRGRALRLERTPGSDVKNHAHWFDGANDSVIGDWLLREFGTSEPVHHDGWDHYRLDDANVWQVLSERDLAAKLAGAQRDGLMWIRGGEGPKPLNLGARHQTAIVEHTRVLAPAISWADAPPGVAFACGTFMEVRGREIVARKLTPEDRVRHTLTVPYEKGARCDRWLQFLGEVWGEHPDNAQKQDYLQEWFGALIAKLSTRYQVAIVLEGAGDNGKSRVLDPLLAMIPHAARRSHSFAELGSNNFTLADLEGAWLNSVGDMSHRDLAETGALKAAIDGTPVDAARKYRDSRNFRPVAGHIAACNELPVSHDTSHGFWRRFCVLTFTRQWREGDPRRDPHLKEKLTQEAPGVALWALEGLRRILERGQYIEPESSVAAKQAWSARSNSVIDYFQSELTDDFELSIRSHPRKGTPTEALWEGYKGWCERTGRKYPSAHNTFSQKLTQLGYPSERTRAEDGRHYRAALWFARDDEGEQW